MGGLAGNIPGKVGVALADLACAGAALARRLLLVMESVDRAGWFLRRQFLDRREHPKPDRPALHVALVEQRVRPHGGLDHGILATLAHQHDGGVS